MKRFILAAVLALAVFAARAQDVVALKTNLLHDATASANLGVEVGIGDRWTVEAAASARMFDAYGIMLDHVIVRPELKYWFCEKFNGLFVSAYGMGGRVEAGHFWDFSQYYERFPNLKTFLLKDADMLSMGVGIGYDWILGRHWNLEAEMNLGYMYLCGDEYYLSQDADGKYYLPDDAEPLLKGSIFDYVGPTRLSLSIVYLF